MRVAILLYAAAAVAYSTSVNLLQVNDKNFKEVVQGSGKFTFVDFYADWCRHCKQLMPTIEQLADSFEPYSDLVQVVKINGDKDGKRMSKKYVSIGYPTMLMFHGNDEPVEFSGSRDLTSLSNFVQQLSGVRLGEAPPSSGAVAPPVRSFADHIIPAHDFNFEEIVLGTDKVSVVIFSGSKCAACKDFWPTVEYLSEAFKKDGEYVQFVSVTTDGANSTSILLETYNVKRVPTLLFFNPHSSYVDDEGYIVPTKYNGNESLQSLVDQVNEMTGLQRDADGQLTENAGKIPELDKLIRGKKSGLEILERLNRGSITHPMLPYYKKLINKIVNGESEFFQREVDRLSQILENDIDKLNDNIVDSMQSRLNVLRVFL